MILCCSSISFVVPHSTTDSTLCLLTWTYVKLISIRGRSPSTFSCESARIVFWDGPKVFFFVPITRTSITVDTAPMLYPQHFKRESGQLVFRSVSKSKVCFDPQEFLWSSMEPRRAKTATVNFVSLFGRD